MIQNRLGPRTNLVETSYACRTHSYAFHTHPILSCCSRRTHMIFQFSNVQFTSQTSSNTTQQQQQTAAAAHLDTGYCCSPVFAQQRHPDTRHRRDVADDTHVTATVIQCHTAASSPPTRPTTPKHRQLTASTHVCVIRMTILLQRTYGSWFVCPYHTNMSC